MQSESGKLAPYVPRALLARLARPIDVLTETVPCTMVFADVSGFTRLSERLSRRGEEGAEQLVDASERARTPANVARTDCDIGEILSDQGRLEEAAEHLARARLVWSATAERRSVAFVDLLMARLDTRRGEGAAAVPRLEAAMGELRRFSMDAYASLAEALLAEAEAFGGDPERALQLAREQLELTDRHLPLLARVAGIALARLGRTDEAREELRGALHSARERRSEYDVAAAIDAIDTLEGAAEELLREREAILARLNIARLPAPALDVSARGATPSVL